MRENIKYHEISELNTIFDVKSIVRYEDERMNQSLSEDHKFKWVM